ncbi:Exodeoxyribonuclease VII large subunit [Caloranaerobacter azorensis DSM 13643]|uniref:Exodeoxyribonuclease 7 large subunit n=1 Tax=Caloranaerobacter azorensis DSM 13643 TaxID=1121264 RepID=A0A1M5VN41_9FIRM|nr:exodeoxyribonuclease VII large subunit [Caloranaerobacter azorensis]SHH76647.1 Exodeoxyribonuclease VII large subunit [Caloranaerobacter azorensis DSM 13643]
MEFRALTVSELNNYLKRVLINDPILNSISVEGEISNLKQHKNGHLYFSLKDEKSKVNCVMFNSEVEKIKFNIENGLNVIVSGYVSIYERDGIYQLYVRNIKPVGLGELYLAFEQLKKKLQNEGLFDKEKKKRLPYIPKKVGVVTSPSGAAVRDIIKVMRRRLPSVDIIIYPVLVQGVRAADEISSAIKFFNQMDDIDVIIVGRGGGSIEELWAFNEEIVAKAIYESKIPVVSAVGHETDFTISDYVADLRAPTPSAAAELVVPDIIELKEKIFLQYERLIKSYEGYIKNKENLIKNYKASISSSRFIEKITATRQKLEYCYRELLNSFDKYISNNLNSINLLNERLNSLNPKKILNRGYAIPIKEDGEIVKSIYDVINGEILTLILNDGSIKVKVIDKSSALGVDSK